VVYVRVTGYTLGLVVASGRLLCPFSGIPLETAMANETLSIKLEPELKVLLEEEAHSRGRKKSGYARDIIADHFSERGNPSLAAKLDDLATQVANLREGLASGDSQELARHALREMGELRSIVAGMAAAVHHSFSAYMTQLNFQDRGEYMSRFEALRKQYQAKND